MKNLLLCNCAFVQLFIYPFLCFCSVGSIMPCYIYNKNLSCIMRTIVALHFDFANEQMDKCTIALPLTDSLGYFMFPVQELMFSIRKHVFSSRKHMSSVQKHKFPFLARAMSQRHQLNCKRAPYFRITRPY